MANTLRRVSLPLLLIVLLSLLATLISPALAKDPQQRESPPSSGVSEEKEELHDSDRNKILDDLDKRIRKAKDEDSFPIVLLFNRPLSQIDFDGLKRQLGDFKTDYKYPVINGVALTLDVKHIRDAAALGEVHHLEFDATARAVLNTAEPWSGVTKSRTDFGVNGNADGQPTYSKNDIVIAVIDTGIYTGHVDLDGGKVIGWKDIVAGAASPYDDNGHGTHVASIIAGEGQANAAYAGVAPGAALVGIKVLNSAGSGSLSQVLAGVQWAIDNKTTYGIRIINLSLGLSGSSDGTDALSQMVNAAVSAGIVTVVAAGNEGPASRTIGSPGAAANVITVGSMADPGEGGFFLSYFSSRGPTADGRIKPDIASFGHGIMAAKSGTAGSYITMSGTSMATPFVAGVVALMENANPSLSPSAAKSMLTSAAVDWGPAGADIDYGAGRLDAYAAVKAAAGAASGIPPVIPEHQYVSGSLAGTGSSNLYNVNVTYTSYPIAVTLVMPTWNAVDFDIYMYNPSGTRVAAAEGVTRQETISYQPSVAGTYKLEVRSYSGSGAYFADICAGTAAADTVPPAAPTGLAVSVPVSNGRVLNLAWNANSEPDRAGYNVYRGTITGGPYAKANGSPVTAASYGDSGLTNGLTYFYVVTAVDTSGNESARSTESSGTPVDNKAPAISNVLAVPSSTSAIVSWTTDEPSDSTVEYGATSALGQTASNASLVTGHSMNLTGLTAATTYFYQVRSKDASGNPAASAVLTFPTTATPGAISGTVTNASTGAPLSGATVTDGTRSAVTDINGAYTLANVPAGTYTVTASRTGYAAASKIITVTAGATASASFALTAAATTGNIAGKVTAANTGLPIAGARVSAGNRTVFTDGGGNYTISNLSPGSYQVQASASGYRRVRRTVTVTAGATTTANFSLSRG